MRENFSRSLDRTLTHEGGYSDHPKDPGGATNKGVTQRVYDLFRQAKKLALRSVKLITGTEVREIYRDRYWNVVAGDQLPAGIDYVVFDGAVNSGPGQAVKWLQRALGRLYTGKIDGRVGASTLAAIAEHTDHDKLIAAILERRLAFLQALKTWGTFGKGWSRRVGAVKAVGQAWAMGSIGPAVEYIPGGEAKGTIEDAKAAPSTAPGDVAAGGGAAGGGIGTVLNDAKDQLTLLAWANEHIGTIVAVLVIASTVLVVGGIAWRFYAKRKAAKLADALDLNQEAPA